MTSPQSRLRTPRGLRNLALTGAAAAAGAALGALATTPESQGYGDLGKPSWQPPPIAFPLVWAPLYADIAVVSAPR
jgi:benzodiazapine receptor